MVQIRPGSTQSSDPVERLEFSGRVFATKFSPFPSSSNLLAVGLQSSVTIGQCVFPEENSDNTEGFQWTVLKEIHHDTRVQTIAWSPKTNLMMSPKVLEFATSGTDHKVRQFTSDGDSVQVKVLKGHSDYVNTCVYEPETGDQLLTGSDDHTVKMWEAGDCVSTLHFKSPVMTVAWHTEEVGKVLIGQKSGVISLYNAVSLQPIMSLDCSLSPLLSIDWSEANSLHVTAVVSSELVMFDMSSPSQAVMSRTVHSEGARYVASTDMLVATGGRPGNCVKVWHSKSGVQLLSNEMVVIGGLCWHFKLPYLAVGGDREIHCLLLRGGPRDAGGSRHPLASWL